MNRPRVAVVGGGISGLAAAHHLASTCPAPEVIVLEGSDRLGGKIHTGSFAELPVETGPDTMLARVPEALELCRRLGLSDQLISPATGRAYVWARGRLRPLPPGHLGVPGRLAVVARSGILSPAGLARASLDLVLPPSHLPSATTDPTIAEAVGARLGNEAVEVLVEPLLAGINAGRADRLSLAATAPDIAALAASSRSLVLGVRSYQRRRPPERGRPVFLSLPGGLSRLIERLVADLKSREVEVRTGDRVLRVERDQSHPRRYNLALEGPERLSEVDAVVVTASAPVASSLLSDLSPRVAQLLAGIHYASVGVVTLSYPQESISRPLDGSGFLVPRREGWLTTAATWISSKWPALRPRGRILVRASTGRAGDDRFAQMDDETLVRRLHGELCRAMGSMPAPLDWRVDRWPQSFPQYESGHQARIAAIETGLGRDAPGVVVAGAAYRGVGIASCIRQAASAAESVKEHVGGTTPARPPAGT